MCRDDGVGCWRSNDKCITCGECSRYCQIGIDVMGFAKNKQEFSNKNTSCIHCGICVTVCPMDVLSFDSNGTGTMTAALRSRPIMRRPSRANRSTWPHDPLSMASQFI